MTQLEQINNKEFLQELKDRVMKNKLSEEEIFSALENSHQSQIITEYKKVDYSKLTRED
jgi:hypothetical protein